PWEPRVHGLLARQARREGRLDEAAWRVDIALKLPLPDQLVLKEAEALGWSTAKTSSRSLPLPADNERRSPWPWFVGGLLTCLGLILVGGYRRDLILVGAALMAVVIWWVLPTAPRGVEPPSIPDELVHPLAGGPCLATPAHHDGGGLRVSVACDGVRHALVVSQIRPNWEAHGETDAHQISIVGDDEPSLEVVAAADVLVETVKTVEADGYRVPVLRDGPAAVPTGRPAWLALEPETRAELEVVGALVCVAFFIALLTLFGVMRSVLGAWTVSESRRPWLLTAFVLAILLHGLAPDRMMMVYGGYDLAAHLIDGQVPRYGAGSVWFYGPAMWLLGSDHSWMQSLNRVAGLLCLVVAWDLGRLLWKKGEVPSAWILVLLPVLWRGHTSESIVIIPTLLLLLSMWHLASGASRELGRAVVLALA
ncbi:MAG: hypothetical protein VX938_02420, partial [Myxococcota bacterium]|nr:hypothetical protein [Myxococcota bacterium]